MPISNLFAAVGAYYEGRFKFYEYPLHVTETWAVNSTRWAVGVPIDGSVTHIIINLSNGDWLLASGGEIRTLEMAERIYRSMHRRACNPSSVADIPPYGDLPFVEVQRCSHCHEANLKHTLVAVSAKWTGTRRSTRHLCRTCYANTVVCEECEVPLIADRRSTIIRYSRHSHSSRGGRICPVCVSNRVNAEPCSVCHRIVSAGHQHTPVGGDPEVIVCETCHENHRYTCSACDDVHYSPNPHRVGCHILCTDCFDENYIYCVECNEVVDQEDAYDGEYCCDCYNRLREDDDDYDDCCGSIHGYHCRPRHGWNVLRVKGEPTHALTLGFELEMEVRDGGCRGDIAEYVVDEWSNSERIFHLQEDGSISYGFELTTQPATLRWHKENAPWEEVTHYLRAHRCRSHNTSTCGLHVHVGSKDMTQTHRIRLGMFIHSQKDRMVAIARRSGSYWARFKDIKGKLKESGNNCERYEALNWQRGSTVEFRLFKGTLKYETLIATLEFVHAAVTWSKITPSPIVADIARGWESFTRFVRSNREYAGFVERWRELLSLPEDSIEIETESEAEGREEEVVCA